MSSWVIKVRDALKEMYPSRYSDNAVVRVLPNGTIKVDGWANNSFKSADIVAKAEQLFAAEPDEQTVIKIRQIKQEAERRILLVMPEYKQRNSLAEALHAIFTKRNVNTNAWTTEEQTKVQNGLGAFVEINRIRARSNAIEAMNPLPADITDDDLWKG